jgi:hypothetical protein
MQVNFIRQMNKKPIEIVEEFLNNQKNLAREKLCANGSTPYQVHVESFKSVVPKLSWCAAQNIDLQGFAGHSS